VLTVRWQVPSQINPPLITETLRQVIAYRFYLQSEYAQNRHLMIHEFSSFESGVVQAIPTVRDFVMSRTHAKCPASERLHAVW